MHSRRSLARDMFIYCIYPGASGCCLQDIVMIVVGAYVMRCVYSQKVDALLFR